LLFVSRDFVTNTELPRERSSFSRLKQRNVVLFVNWQKPTHHKSVLPSEERLLNKDVLFANIAKQFVSLFARQTNKLVKFIVL